MNINNSYNIQQHEEKGERVLKRISGPASNSYERIQQHLRNSFRNRGEANGGKPNGVVP